MSNLTAAPPVRPPCYSSHDLFQLFTLFIKLKSASCMKSAAPQEVEAFAEAANELMTQLMMTMKCRPRDTKNCRFFYVRVKMVILCNDWMNELSRYEGRFRLAIK
ncbi:hypothetical protein CDAR_417811 [Caerostris darwini]|uniref:Uncharacterized protein n=1 Tax=Caerostris darwini TaxID=1538125 RepID=A0AAV4PVA1_9ARAC|nr:hypothetical protein CDAR_417811 [Caerostris darwini]